MVDLCGKLSLGGDARSQGGYANLGPVSPSRPDCWVEVSQVSLSHLIMTLFIVPPKVFFPLGWRSLVGI